jgi:hypothetical protein
VAVAAVGLGATQSVVQQVHRLGAAGLLVVPIETRYAKAALSAMTHKTDRNNACGIA